ncbi:hypothetical protein ACPV3W_21325 [Vibrio parahaemolyticus]|uniref:hypothetical protein n=1 Tax=Vibrio parahaemolyticus TaxID=670 RepID=UPI001DCC6F0B|nr:hypothetical protein [Vibrio parahaemolyticus]
MGCYFCGGEVTGVEHIPPRSFFPKGKRQDLITVDSCDIHNQEKSKEDEYIRAILLGSIKLDDQEHIKDLRNTNNRALERSVKRAFDKSPTKEQAKVVLEIIEKYKGDPVGGAKALDEITSQGIMSFGLMGLVNKDTREETIIDNNGEEVSTTSFVYDRARFDSFFECMARGIFFHELGERWEGKVNVLPHTFLRDNAPQRDKDLSHEYLQHFDWSESKGAQKEYFCYEGANMDNPESGKRESIFFNFCLFNTFYFTAVFPL